MSRIPSMKMLSLRLFAPFVALWCLRFLALRLEKLRFWGLRLENLRFLGLPFLAALLVSDVAVSAKPPTPAPFLFSGEGDKSAEDEGEHQDWEQGAVSWGDIFFAAGDKIVIPEKELREGYRNINEVLATVPGFEGGRQIAYGRSKEVLSQGMARSVLVLVNGVPMASPLNKALSLDRQFPLEMVERIEIIKGAGSLRYGADAYLGLVNIVTHKAKKGSKVFAIAGGGSGPAEPDAFKAGVGLSHRFNDDFSLVTYVDLFSRKGARYELPYQKLVGPSPMGGLEDASFFLLDPYALETGTRDFWLSLSGNLELGPVSLDWLVPVSREHLAMGPTGSPFMTSSFSSSDSRVQASRIEDSVTYVGLSYQDRFLEGRLGLEAKTYLLSWRQNENPRVISPLSPAAFVLLGGGRDQRSTSDSDFTLQPGFQLASDFLVMPTLRLNLGGNVALDLFQNPWRRTWRAWEGEGLCGSGFLPTGDPSYFPCERRDSLLTETQRVKGGVYLGADWKAHKRFSLSAGVRSESSSQFETAFLYALGGALNWDDKHHLRLFSHSSLNAGSMLDAYGLDAYGTAAVGSDVTGTNAFRGTHLKPEKAYQVALRWDSIFYQGPGILQGLQVQAGVNYSYLDDLFTFQDEGLSNMGKAQTILGDLGFRLDFLGGSTLWANYTYLHALQDTRKFRNLYEAPEHLLNIGGRLSFWEERIKLIGRFNMKSQSQAYGSPPYYLQGREDYSIPCSVIRGQGSQDPKKEAVCNEAGMASGLWVHQDNSAFTQIPQWVGEQYQLDLGIQVDHIWRDLRLQFFVYNALNRYGMEGDPYSHPLYSSVLQPKSGLSFFGSASIGL